MYWSDKVAKQIIDSGEYKPYHVDDMKTLSGYPTVGSLRGPFVHDFIFKSLKHAGVDTIFTYVYNDFDPIDDLTEDLKEKFTQYLGFPLKTAPSPVEGFDSFADYYADDFSKVLSGLGIEPEYVSSWELYHQGKFNVVIKEALDSASEIQEIYHRVSGSQKKEMGWLPLQVICPSCGKLGTTRVHDWDGETVAFICEPNLVKWAQGCGYKGRISPFGGNGKLPWKVDWPAHWKVLGVTIEGAGKDHSVAGGSRDVAREICQRVFKIKEPFNLPYEFFTLGGKKMSSSKGLGVKAREVFNFLPAEVTRFLFSRTDYRQEIDFNPVETTVIPDLFDEYDRCFLAFVDSGDPDLARAFEMSQIRSLPKKEKIFLPRFRDVVNFIQSSPDKIDQIFTEAKGSALTKEEQSILDERKKYAQIWIDSYAPEEFKFQLSQSTEVSLDKEQKEYLKGVIELINQDLPEDDLQKELYSLTQSQGIETKKAFQALYLVLIGKDHGPKAGVLLSANPKEKIVERLKEVTK